MKPETKILDAYQVAYARSVGPYGPETCGKAFEELMQWAGPKGLLGKGQVIGLYWDDPRITRPEECRTDACVSITDDVEVEGVIKKQTIDGGKYLVFDFKIKMEEFEKAWLDAFKWIGENKIACEEKPCYELYHNDGTQHPEGIWDIEICIPIK